MALEASRPPLQSVGNYDLVEKIAEGGMGTVYKARHRDSGEIVAIKVVAQHMVSNPVLLKRFEQEYNAAKQLNHPNIVRAIEYGVTGSTPYLVMEYVNGDSLGQKINRDGKLPEKDAIRLIAQVAQGLHRAHKEKLIHRDVKPDNILVTPDGQAKLTDLGLVKEIEADLNLTRTGRGLGTPHFMAPEQFKNAKNVDPRCDIYSLGATLYMMVTGEMPFKSSGPLDAYMKKIENKLTPPRQLVPTLSERIDWAIRRSMSADPDQRPATCREFVEDLTGRSTRKPTAAGQTANVPADVWYMVYKDDDGVTHTVKGTTAAIRRSLREGLMGDASNVRASREKEGEFLPLRNFPEFRDLVINPSASRTPSPASPAPPRAPAAPAARSVNASAEMNLQDQPTTPAQRALLPSPPPAPHIDLEPARPATGGGWPLWVQLVVLLSLVAASALAGLFLFSRH